MYQALTQVDGRSHKQFRILKKYHNREMKDLKSQLKNQSRSIKSIEQNVSSADSVNVLMKRFENSSSSSSSDSSESHFSGGRPAKRCRAKCRLAKRPPIQNVTVNAATKEVEEECSSAIRNFHNCSLSLVDSKLGDENPDVVLGHVG